MTRKKVFFITICVLLFVGLNLFLVVKDKSNKIERKTYVKKWEKVIERDMYEFLYKEGKLVPSVENQIYLEDSLGSFHEFIVNEGDQVQIGDGLYTYRIQNYYETKTHLERSIQVLDSEISAIEDAITTIESSGSTSTSTFLDEEFSFVSATDEMLKDQYIVEKEKELAQKQAQRDSLNEQLQELQSSGDIVTVGSPYEGTVKSLSLSLANPIITIANPEVAINAELLEEERKKVDTGMPVEIKVEDFPAAFEGSIASINDFPTELKDNKESVYDFSVTFNDQNETGESEEIEEIGDIEETEEPGDIEGAEETGDIEEPGDLEDAEETDKLLPGYQAALKITTNESLQTPAIKTGALNNKSVYKMTKEGTVVRQKVELGIRENQRSEVVSGLTSGEIVVNQRKRVPKSGDKFVTPLNHKKVSYHKLKNSNQTLRNKHLILGLLSR